MGIRTGIGIYLFVALAVCLFGIGVNWLGGQLPADAQGRDTVADNVADFRQQLESGLRARVPAEFEFIGRVVAVVERGELSKGLVNSVFQWARRQNGEYPFPYFQRAMLIVAEQRNVDI